MSRDRANYISASTGKLARVRKAARVAAFGLNLQELQSLSR